MGMGSWLLREVETRETRTHAGVRIDLARFSQHFETRSARSQGGAQHGKQRAFHFWGQRDSSSHASTLSAASAASSECPPDLPSCAKYRSAAPQVDAATLSPCSRD